MSRPAWAAVFAAIAFPSVALVIVLLAGRPAGQPAAHPPGRPPPGLAGPHPGPPPGKGPPPPIHDEELVRLRRQLELSDEQVERIWKIGAPARRRMAELELDIGEKERELRELLAADEVDETRAVQTLEELHDLHFDMEKLRLLTPLRLRGVLTPEQRSKLIELWRERGRHGPGKGPPPPGGFGPPRGKGPPTPGGFGPPRGKRPPPPPWIGQPPPPPEGE